MLNDIWYDGIYISASVVKWVGGNCICRKSYKNSSGDETANMNFYAVRPEATRIRWNNAKLECGPMPNLMVALPNTGGAVCSTPQSLADAHY